MSKFIAKYIDRCNKCNHVKSFPTAPVGKLMPNETPSEPWTDVVADLIVKLPLSQDYNLILVVIDRYLKMTYLIAYNKAISSLGLAKLYRDNIWKLHGLPNMIISD